MNLVMHSTLPTPYPIDYEGNMPNAGNDFDVFLGNCGLDCTSHPGQQNWTKIEQATMRILASFLVTLVLTLINQLLMKLK